MASEASTGTQVRPPAHRTPLTTLHLALTPALLQLVQSPLPQSERCKLLELPVELLDIIFRSTYRQSAPLCRDLIRYYDNSKRRTFRDVKISNAAKLSSFSRSYALRTSICTAFESFTVAPGKGQPAGGDFDLLPGLPPALVLCMPSVRRLELHGDQIVGTFLEQAASALSPILPVLSDVTLVANLVGQADPYHPTLLCGLGALERLQKLHLSLYVADGKLAEVEQHVPYECAAVRELKLVDCKSSPGVIDFIERCTQLVKLDMSSIKKTPASARFLMALGKLGTVTHLHLTASPQGNGWKLLKSLKFLTVLKHLVLGAGCVCRDDVSFDILRLVPITHLEFQLDTVVSASRLLKLLDGDDKHSHLESLVLNQVQASLGGIENLSWRYDSDALGAWYDHEGWTLPEWTSTFSRRGVQGLVHAARRNGIALSGDAVDAVGIEDQIKEWREKIEQVVEEGTPSASESDSDGW